MAKDTKENKEEENDEEIEEEDNCTKSIQVQTLNIGIEIVSEDKNDTLDGMKKLVEYFLDKYK